MYVELLATLAIAATHQSELAQDLEIYASQEFGLVELADAHSRASALMPQKKNPYALAAVRTQAGQAAGDVAAALVALHTGSARTDHFHLLNGSVPRALDEAVAVARLTAAVLDGIELHPERFAQIARESFVTAADVADVLALEGGLDYRSAHKVVGRAVRDLVDAGDPPSALTADRLAAAAEAAIGRPVDDRRGRAASRTRPGRVRGGTPPDRLVVARCDARDARRPRGDPRRRPRLERRCARAGREGRGRAPGARTRARRGVTAPRFQRAPRVAMRGSLRRGPDRARPRIRGRGRRRGRHAPPPARTAGSRRVRARRARHAARLRGAGSRGR